jgi:phage terminase large subunit-like protein
MNLQDLKDVQKAHLTVEEFKILSREDQENYLRLMNEEISWLTSRKILLYEPLEKQKLFHTSLCPRRALFGGNRVGKTTAGGMEFLYHITGQYPEWYPEEKKLKGSIKGRIIAKDFQKGVGEVITPFMNEWLDTSLIARKIKNPMGIPTKYELKNGSVFDILTHEQSTEQFEGWRGHIAWFDEPPPRDKYVATLRGLVDYSGRHWLTLTPLTQPWIYDEIYTAVDKAYNFVTTVDITENPYLTKQAIKEFEDSLTQEEKEARLHGRFLHLTGLIYKEFDPQVHIIEPITIKSHWTRYMAIDPHERTPTAVLWLAVDEKDNHYIYDELWMKDMDIKQMAEAIHVQEGQLKTNVSLIDPHADKDNVAAGGFNVRKELMRHGVFTERANSDPMLGKARIRQALTPRFSSLTQRYIPQLHISKYCTQTIYEFQHYIWDEYRRNKEEYDQKETAKKKNDHFMDCLRYIYNYNPRYILKEEEETDIEYTGTYTKYPVKKQASGSYHDLVEGKAGNF